MADTKPSTFTTTSTMATTDVLPVITGMGGTPAQKIITKAAFKTDLALVKGDVGLGSVDNTADSAKTVAAANAVKSATTTVNTSSATAPSSGQVLTATSSTAATWQTPSGGLPSRASMYAFKVYTSSNQASAFDVDIPFNTAAWNYGSAFDTATNHNYVVPVTGLYTFKFHVHYTGNLGADSDWKIEVNGFSYWYTFLKHLAADRDCWGSVDIDLTLGNTVALSQNVSSNTLLADQYQTWFEGRLVAT